MDDEWAATPLTHHSVVAEGVAQQEVPPAVSWWRLTAWSRAGESNMAPGGAYAARLHERNLEAAALAEAPELQIVNEAAERRFFESDLDGDGKLTKEELGSMFMHMLEEGGYVKTADERTSREVREYIDYEVKLAMTYDKNWDGEIDFEEFVVFYNTFVDKMQFRNAGHLDLADLRTHFTAEEGRLARAEDAVENKLGFGQVKADLDHADEGFKRVDLHSTESRVEIEEGVQRKDHALKQHEITIEHREKWIAAVDTMRTTEFTSGDAVLEHLIRTIEEFHVPDGTGHPCGVGVLMLREVGASSGRLWRKKGNKAGEKYGDLMDLPTGHYWPLACEKPLVLAAYAALNTKLLQYLNSWPNDDSRIFVNPLMQLDGHVFGVVTNGESPVPEGACNGAWRNGRGTAVLRGDVPWDGGAAW